MGGGDVYIVVKFIVWWWCGNIEVMLPVVVLDNLDVHAVYLIKDQSKLIHVEREKNYLPRARERLSMSLGPLRSFVVVFRQWLFQYYFIS